VVNYRRILRRTEGISGGGKTPWGSWISCERRSGQVYQADPHGNRAGRRTALGGNYMGETNLQSFAYYDPGPSSIIPTFYITNGGRISDPKVDMKDAGELRRFTPDNDAMSYRHRRKDLRKWGVLESGTIEYLVLSNVDETFWWTSDLMKGRESAAIHFPHPGSVEVRGGYLYFISYSNKMLFVLDLKRNTYESSKTNAGVFEGQPSQIKRLLQSYDENGLLYFCEDGVADVGLHGRNGNGDFFTILDAPHWRGSEASSLALSPNKKHMYIAFSDAGILYEVTRDDGFPFEGGVVEIKYHR